MNQKKEDGCAILVHAECRKKFTDKRKSTQIERPIKKLRSSMDQKFEWKNHCFLCGETDDCHHPDRESFSKVMTLEVLLQCAERRNDLWGQNVKDRLQSCNDLVAEEVIYHTACMHRFKFNKKTDKNVGRPVDTALMDGFEKICHWLEEEGDCELYTLNELQQKIEEMGAKGYTNKHLKHKLQERYGDHICFTEDCGRANIVCFKEFASFVVQEKKKQKEETKKDIIKAAAKIIQSEIREVKKTSDFYPTVDEIQNINEGFEWISESLKSFLEVLIPHIVKQVSSG